MKKIPVALIAALFVILTFSACDEKPVGNIPVTQTTHKTLQAVTSYVNPEGNLINEAQDSSTSEVKYLDKNGNLKYIEKYLYDEADDVIGFAYYDKNGAFVAKYLTAGEKQGFFHENNDPMTETEFSVKMDSLGVYSY